MRGRHFSTSIVVLATGVALSAAQQTQPPRETASGISRCGVSDDPEYAFTPKKPVQVGGGAMYVAARERRYLDALRGPAGGAIKYKRTGTHTETPNSLTILDVYHVTYDGLEKPLVIYLDAYHYDDALKAPQGFTCGVPIALSVPPPDAFTASDSLEKIAIQQGATQEFAPIPLDPAGTTTRGVVFDRFRTIARAARAAAVAAKPLPSKPVPDITRTGTVVLAYPLTCDGKTLPAKAIDLISLDRNGRPVTAPREEPFVTGAAIAALVAGFEAPPETLAVKWQRDPLGPNDTIRITYAEACAGSSEVDLAVKYTPAKLLASPEPPLPPGVPAGSFVRLQVLIDLSGSFQDPSHFGGPEHLVAPASLAVRTTWKVEPARINGAPVVEPVTLLVRFR